MLRSTLVNLDRVDRTLDLNKFKAFDTYRATISLEFIEDDGKTSTISTCVEAEYGFFGETGCVEPRIKKSDCLRERLIDEISKNELIHNGNIGPSDEETAINTFRRHGESLNNWTTLIELLLLSHFKHSLLIDSHAITLAPIKLLAVLDYINGEDSGLDLDTYSALFSHSEYQLGITMDKVNEALRVTLFAEKGNERIQGAMLQLDSHNIEESLSMNASWLMSHARAGALERVEVENQVDWLIEKLKNKKELLSLI